jgi:hypothetical protein
MMRNLLTVITVLLILNSCSKNPIKHATIVFHKENDSLDSISNFSREELNLLYTCLSYKVKTDGKFPVSYFLNIYRSNGLVEEYNGNGFFLRDQYIYKIQDTAIQRKYLELINSKLPFYLKQR